MANVKKEVTVEGFDGHHGINKNAIQAEAMTVDNAVRRVRLSAPVDAGIIPR